LSHPLGNERVIVRGEPLPRPECIVDEPPDEAGTRLLHHGTSAGARSVLTRAVSRYEFVVGGALRNISIESIQGAALFDDGT
jgi:hypothetical protein